MSLFDVRDHCLHVWGTMTVAAVLAYDPAVVIFGGGVMKAADVILPSVRNYVRHNIWAPLSEPRIVAASARKSCGTVWCRVTVSGEPIVMYDRHPFLPVGNADECLAGWEQIANVLSGLDGPICIECYPGVFVEEVEQAVRGALRNAAIFRTADLFLPPNEIESKYASLLTDDPVFGRMNAVEFADFLDEEKLRRRSMELARWSGHRSLSARARRWFVPSQRLSSMRTSPAGSSRCVSGAMRSQISGWTTTRSVPH